MVVTVSSSESSSDSTIWLSFVGCLFERLGAIFTQVWLSSITSVSSASVLSTSNSRPVVVEDYIERCFHAKKDVPKVRVPYNLNDITRIPTPYVNHTEAEKALCRYIQTAIGQEVKNDKDLIFIPHVCTIPTSEVKRPDCSIVKDGATIFICELESASKWSTTCLKLTIHLAQMLASL